MQDIKAVFDIGNGYIKGAVFGQDEGKHVILVKDMIRTKGMRKGKVLDNEDFTQSLATLVESFIKKLGGDFIDEVYIGISHPETIISRVQEQKRIMTDTIQQEDINHLNTIVADISAKNNYETLKIIPVYREIDDHKKEKDPLGLKGKKLSLIADVFLVPKNFYQNLVDVFEKLELNVVDIIPNILASSEAILDFDLKDLGTILIDIGHNQTSFVVYEEGYPLMYGTLPVGGENVTKDLGIGLEIDIKDADTIKREKGVLIMDEKYDEDEEVDIYLVSQIIAARYEQIFTQIQKNLESIERDGRLPGGVILTGGAVKIQNLEKLAKQIFKVATFFGKEKQLHLGELSNNQQFINLLGLYSRGNKYYEGRPNFFSMNFDIVGKVTKFIKNLF